MQAPPLPNFLPRLPDQDRSPNHHSGMSHDAPVYEVFFDETFLPPKRIEVAFLFFSERGPFSPDCRGPRWTCRLSASPLMTMGQAPGHFFRRKTPSSVFPYPQVRPLLSPRETRG